MPNIYYLNQDIKIYVYVFRPPTPCPWEGCNRKLATKVGLFNHLRMHRGDTDFKCTVCNKGKYATLFVIFICSYLISENKFSFFSILSLTYDFNKYILKHLFVEIIFFAW